VTTAQKSRTLTRQVSHLGEVRFDGAVWVDVIYGSPGELARVINQKITIVAGRAISMPMCRADRARRNVDTHRGLPAMTRATGGQSAAVPALFHRRPDSRSASNGAWSMNKSARPARPLTSLVDLIEQPLALRRPQRFVIDPERLDLFDGRISEPALRQVWRTMHLAAERGHIFQVWSRHVERMAALVPALNHGIFPDRRDAPRHLRNLWLGMSIHTQQEADERMPTLLRLGAQLHFAWCVPLRGELALEPYFLDGRGLAWVVAGGGETPPHPVWLMKLRLECELHRVPFHFYGWGAWMPAEDAPDEPLNGQSTVIVDPDGSVRADGVAGFGRVMVRVGLSRSGKLLDGRVWDAVPDPEQNR
jgi:protein gp37